MLARKILFICGPTCSGKSSIAVRIASETGRSIVNADSVQMYDCLPILSASPSAADKAIVPHMLYNFLQFDQKFSVARYLQIASKLIEGLQHMPVVVGGSGLYISALLFGIHHIPEVSSEIRAAAELEIASIGAAALHARLLEVDPKFAKSISPFDSYRVRRCYEVFLQTGRAMSSFLQGERLDLLAQYQKQVVVLLPERQALYRACDTRFDSMLANGALEEVESELGKAPSSIIGFQELSEYILGTKSLEEASQLAKLRTRQYAKRQCTWFKNQLQKPLTVSFNDFSSLKQIASEILDNV